VAVVNIVDIYTYFGLEVDSFDCILLCVHYEPVFFRLFWIVLDGCVISCL
jgi:hypothetical protein